MWARTAEVMLGCWLAASPFVFRHSPDEPSLWVNDLGCATLAISFALLSFWPRLLRAHLLNLAVALWLLAFGYLGASHPAPPAAQNQIVVALLLAMLAIVPTRPTVPPEGWSEVRASESGRERG